MMGDIETYENGDQEGIFSKVLRAGRRTYFFDVRETRAGDYYLTITESKKNTNDDGSFFYKKHKIYLYKEDFHNFKEILNETTDFIINEKGEEVISERHQKNYDTTTTPTTESVEKNTSISNNNNESISNNTESFTDVNFEDI